MSNTDPKGSSPVVNQIELTPVFKLVFITATVLTILSLLVAGGFSLIDQPTESQKHIISMCSDTWKIGFGLIAGLIGGKAA